MKKLQGITVAEVINLLKEQDQDKICMVGDDSSLIPFPLTISQHSFYKHPNSDDTIVSISADDPDKEYIEKHFDKIDAVVFIQNKNTEIRNFNPFGL